MRSTNILKTKSANNILQEAEKEFYCSCMKYTINHGACCNLREQKQKPIMLTSLLHAASLEFIEVNASEIEMESPQICTRSR